MIGVAPGANAAILPEHVQKIPAEVFAPGEWLLVAGLEIPIGTVTAVVHRAARVGMKVVLNPAPSDSRLLKAGILHAVDVITPNRVELWQLTGISTGDEEGILEAAASLRAHGPRAVVVTLGAEGCLIAEENAVRRIPAHQVKAIDTVGAGDAFSGALAVALAEGRSLVEASGWASAAAALAVTLPGAQTALPTRAEIDRLASMRIA